MLVSSESSLFLQQSLICTPVGTPTELTGRIKLDFDGIPWQSPSQGDLVPLVPYLGHVSQE